MRLFLKSTNQEVFKLPISSVAKGPSLPHTGYTRVLILNSQGRNHVQDVRDDNLRGGL